jgi:hypothetical protein
VGWRSRLWRLRSYARVVRVGVPHGVLDVLQGDPGGEELGGEAMALVLRPGDAEVRVRGLADPVDGAAEDGDLGGVLVDLQAALDLQ